MLGPTFARNGPGPASINYTAQSELLVWGSST